MLELKKWYQEGSHKAKGRGKFSNRKDTGLESASGLASELCPSLDVYNLGQITTLLSLSFLIFKMGMMILPHRIRQ